MTHPTPIVFGRAFVLYRDHDVSGVSGTGTVADGVEFPDGTVAIRWRGQNPSTVIWPSLAAAMHVHGHSGSTRTVWATAEAAVALARARRLANDWAMLRTHGGAAYELRAALDGPAAAPETDQP